MEILATCYADPEKSAGTWAGSEPIPTAAENKKRYRSAGFLRIGVLFWDIRKKIDKKTPERRELYCLRPAGMV